jgi:hypothetical protein
MEVRFAKIISALFHPLLMPTYGFLLLLFTNNYVSNFLNPDFKYHVLIVTFAFTFLLPVLNAIVLLKLKRISSLEMEDAKERIIPYGGTTLYYFSLFYLFWRQNLPWFFEALILGAGVSVLLTLFINFRWKISAHSVGIGGTVGAIFGIMYRMQIDLELVFLGALLVAGLVGYARLKLNAHTPAQVYGGFAAGLAIETGLMLFYQ